MARARSQTLARQLEMSRAGPIMGVARNSLKWILRRLSSFVFGVRIEDDVLITDDGYETLTNFPKELMVIKC